ncbi:hypothetical protein K9L67_01630 [Candidatus Woesearchaeota archaeon]|nr:hypothetical protein [Candidatus Woesearchaeota archaeon]MCF7900904.1 hypothetical protein [Candidatus Woesearchaeota archaeon]MCF8013047.1 hypothetical protein [Candidatus Woesearchaeota archaeon]
MKLQDTITDPFAEKLAAKLIGDKYYDFLGEIRLNQDTKNIIIDKQLFKKNKKEFFQKYNYDYLTKEDGLYVVNNLGWTNKIGMKRAITKHRKVFKKSIPYYTLIIKPEDIEYIGTRQINLGFYNFNNMTLVTSPVTKNFNTYLFHAFFDNKSGDPVYKMHSGIYLQRDAGTKRLEYKTLTDLTQIKLLAKLYW